MAERTLSIIKPDAFQRGLSGAILQRFEQAGLKIVAAKTAWLSRPKAREFYAVHKDRPFFASLVDFMVSGPILVSVLEADDAIQKNRTLMGATDPSKADQGTIRKDFAESIERNSVHGSDGPDTARVEIGHFFSAIELLEYERR